MSIKLLFFLQIHKKAKPYIRFHLIIYSGRVDKKQRRQEIKETNGQENKQPSIPPPSLRGRGRGWGFLGLWALLIIKNLIRVHLLHFLLYVLLYTFSMLWGILQHLVGSSLIGIGTLVVAQRLAHFATFSISID